MVIKYILIYINYVELLSDFIFKNFTNEPLQLCVTYTLVERKNICPPFPVYVWARNTREVNCDPRWTLLVFKHSITYKLLLWIQDWTTIACQCATILLLIKVNPPHPYYHILLQNYVRLVRDKITHSLSRLSNCPLMHVLIWSNSFTKTKLTWGCGAHQVKEHLNILWRVHREMRILVINNHFNSFSSFFVS